MTAPAIGAPAVLSGAGSIDRIAEASVLAVSGDVVVVLDAALAGSRFAGRALAALARPERDVVVHVPPVAEPTAASVDEAAAVVRTVRPAAVLGIGGGSVLDTAKQAAAISAAPFGIEHYALGANELPAGPPVVAIPTTAGTGAEVTRTCVVAAADGRKVWTWGDELLPRLVVLDPQATVTMPPAVTAATGLDAFVHAVEAVSGQRTSGQVAEHAVPAIRSVLDHLPRAVADGADLGARAALQQAALSAGLAIDAGGTGVAHTIGHGLGTLTHVPHGVTVAVGLAAALPWNLAGAPDAYVAVADAIGGPTDELVDIVSELFAAVALDQLVRRLGPLDVTAKDLAAATAAEENRPMRLNNSRPVEEADLLALADATLRVWSELAR